MHIYLLKANEKEMTLVQLIQFRLNAQSELNVPIKWASLIWEMYSHSLLLTNERLVQLTIANEHAKASGETEPSGGTLFCALAMCSLMRMLKMSPQCQQLQLMAFASESKQHSETPEDICAFVCRNDLRDLAICEGENKMKKAFFCLCQCSFACSHSLFQQLFL